MRYCMNFYLNWHRNCQGSKLKQSNYLMKNPRSNFTIHVPVEVEVHTVPHFKAAVNAKVGPRGLKCGSTFM